MSEGKKKKKFIQHGYARGERRVEVDGRSHPARNRAINPIKARGEENRECGKKRGKTRRCLLVSNGYIRWNEVGQRKKP